MRRFFAAVVRQSRSVVVACAVAAALVVGVPPVTQHPTAAAAPTSHARVDPAAMSVRVVDAKGRTVTLGPKATKRLITAINTGGIGTAIIACQAVVPVDLKPYCVTIVTALVQTSLAGNDSLCLQITFGFPKLVRVIFVPCAKDELPSAETAGPGVFEPVPSIVGPGGIVPAPTPGFARLF